MSLPLDSVTPEPVLAPFVSPADDVYLPLEERCLGGTAIGDGAAGREVQVWKIAYDGTSVHVGPDGGADQFVQARAGAYTVSLAFDANMALAYAWQSVNGANLYYFDSTLGSYNILTIADATSCRVGVDDTREFLSAASDIIFAYTRGGQLYWRQQRDRYLTERLVGPSGASILHRCAQNTLNRFQFKLGPP
jgi:hypothetical protein